MGIFTERTSGRYYHGPSSYMFTDRLPPSGPTIIRGAYFAVENISAVFVKARPVRGFLVVGCYYTSGNYLTRGVERVCLEVRDSHRVIGCV